MLTEEKSKLQKEQNKQKVANILKYIGIGIASIFAGLGAFFLVNSSGKHTSDDDEEYENIDDDWYYDMIEYEKEIDPTGESSGAEDYYSSRPWTDE